MDTIKTLLHATLFRKIDVEHLLNPKNQAYYRFDPQLGYVPDNIIIQDGIDNSLSIYTYEPTGQRKMVNYSDQPCRINTYGNSYTMCQQVSDDETWQERLAARIGESIRNFGCGGYGVYQAYRRAVRMEATDCSSEYIIFGIFDDDHARNLDMARWIRSGWYKKLPSDQVYPLHGLPWAHLRFDLDKGCFVEKPGFCKNEDDLRKLCDPDKFYETFKDDQIVRLFALEIGGQVDNVDDLQDLAEKFNIKVDLRDPKKRKGDATKLHIRYGLKSTEYLLGKMCQWLEDQGKELMVILFYHQWTIQSFLKDNRRSDQQFLYYLKRRGIPYVDTLLKHVNDYKSYNLSYDEYFSRYYVKAAGAAVFGHYNPAGNFFIAMNIKDEIINWLDPKPPAYQES